MDRLSRMARPRHGKLLALLLAAAPAAAPAQVRSDDGTPGPDYWQQQVDFDMEVALDPVSGRLAGSALMRYHNRAPAALPEIWLQLDQNRFRADSLSMRRLGPAIDETARAYLREAAPGIRALRIWDRQGNPIAFEVRDTYAKLRLPEALAPGDSVQLRLRWQLNLLDRNRIRARSGYERLADGGRIFLAAQWYPRPAVFHDDGWHLAPFLGQGEFSLEFGDYQVAVTVPASHVVAATGELTNAEAVLTAEERQRLQLAQSGTAQRISAPGRKGGGSKRWTFRAERVRDFAFVSSAALYWDASSVVLGDRRVLAQAFYPAAGQHLWEPFGLDAIAHTLREFSTRLFPYPWPVASMVNVGGLGMEYPMLGTNAERGHGDVARWDMIGGIIHEVGHNWFPMSVNSNERAYAWMDEGLVCFVEHHVEKAWDEDFLVIYGDPDNLSRYRGQPHQQPLMTPADELTHRIDNAYDYAAAVLNVLRRDVLGPARFDAALAHYAKAWRFKRATATDFFRAMAAASGADLDSFWQEWFYRTQSPAEGAGADAAGLPPKSVPTDRIQPLDEWDHGAG